MAATQRPVTQEALQEPAGERPLWRELPSWFLFGAEDRNIPAALQRFMAGRADARRAIEIPGTSHAIAVSYPEATADLILQAAALPTAARARERAPLLLAPAFGPDTRFVDTPPRYGRWQRLRVANAVPRQAREAASPLRAARSGRRRRDPARMVRPGLQQQGIPLEDPLYHRRDQGPVLREPSYAPRSTLPPRGRNVPA
jgi:hypothetical protein